MSLLDPILKTRTALTALSDRLLALSEESGEMAAQARIAWLDARLPLDSHADIRRALEAVSGICGFLDNWSDCTRTERRPIFTSATRHRAARLLVISLGNLQDDEVAALGVVRDAGELNSVAELLRARAEKLEKDDEEGDGPEDKLYVNHVLPTQEAAAGALDALCALVDAMRAAHVEA
jgi:hypothetical protein